MRGPKPPTIDLTDTERQASGRDRLRGYEAWHTSGHSGRMELADDLFDALYTPLAGHELQQADDGNRRKLNEWRETMFHSRPITEIIQQRYSCRTYLDKPIAEDKRQQLADFLSSLKCGPLGASARFALVAAMEQDRNSLRGLGTYGFIKSATGFIVGAVQPAEKNLEDYGYLMERAILFATDIGLGTCWLGGTFTQSSFAKKISATRNEKMPAVTSIGYIAGPDHSNDWIRQRAGSNYRLPWESLFFHRGFGETLAHDKAGAFAVPLEMVRVGPSASNKQPWRIIKGGDIWHFYLQRTPGYGSGSLAFNLLRLADLQRVDMGIAMCHFELTANELGLKGRWVVKEPHLDKPDKLTEYIVSWAE